MSYVLHLSSTVRLSLCIPVFASGAINGRLNRAMIGWNLEEHVNHTLEIRRMHSPGERRGQFLFRARDICHKQTSPSSGKHTQRDHLVPTSGSRSDYVVRWQRQPLTGVGCLTPCPVNWPAPAR
jgi:hypothetical protein